MMTILNPVHQIFLLADEEVLQNPDLSVLKVAQADEDRGRYYDWMAMNSDSLIEEFDCSPSDLIRNKLPGAF
jgi:bifunctional DNase/RNase